VKKLRLEEIGKGAMDEDPMDEVLLETRRFRVVRHRGRTASGHQYVRETVQHPGAVVILPILDDGRVCLIRNYRVAVGQTLIELPAGTLEPGEDPADTARRELEEETGYRAARIEPLLAFFMSPGILNERMHAYLASGLTKGPPSPEAGEEIEPLLVTWDEALRMVRSAEIQDAKTLAALLYHQWQRGTGG
jgi:ADP-ribose pyrophosphatase